MNSVKPSRSWPVSANVSPWTARSKRELTAVRVRTYAASACRIRSGVTASAAGTPNADAKSAG